MYNKTAVIITSIANDKNWILNNYAEECKKRNIQLIVIGDTKSPQDFSIEGCDFWGIEQQNNSPFELAKLLPANHYCRKNIGYLIAIKNGAQHIIETDDDIIPLEIFWDKKNEKVNGYYFENTNWINVYSFFTDKLIWPRGFPVENVTNEITTHQLIKKENIYCPIQQGLTNKNPDVDAIYRINFELPFTFEKNENIILGKNTWCPFNTQNTFWFKEAFALLYLPSFCSMRMTDIWRSFIAQRIAWECNWNILFHEANTEQERNLHDLMKDFEEEFSGYLNNKTICLELEKLNLKKGKENIFDNMITCYECLINLNLIDKKEITLLNAWINDIKKYLPC